MRGFPPPKKRTHSFHSIHSFLSHPTNSDSALRTAHAAPYCATATVETCSHGQSPRLSHHLVSIPSSSSSPPIVPTYPSHLPIVIAQCHRPDLSPSLRNVDSPRRLTFCSFPSFTSQPETYTSRTSSVYLWNVSSRRCACQSPIQEKCP